MQPLNSRFNFRNADNVNTIRSIVPRINFLGAVAAVMGVLAVKERWDAHKDRQEERANGASHNYAGATESTTNPPPYRDDPDAEDIGLENDVQSRLLGGDEAPVRPTRRKRRSCCVCCGIRCDIVFKALGIVLGLYLCYGIFKVVLWAITPSPTGLENMPEYSTSLGCSAAPFTYSPDLFSVGNPLDDATFVLELTGGAVGTVFLTRSDTQNAVVKMDLRTDDELLLQKVSASFSEDTAENNNIFRLTTPSSASSSNGCMRFDLTVEIPSQLRAVSLVSQSLVHVKYDEHVSLSLSDLTIDLTSPLPENLLLPHEQLNTERTTLKMRGGYLVGSLAFTESADVDTKRGSAVTNLKVAPLPAPASGAAELTTSTGSGRSDVIYSNPERRVITSEHTSSGGDMYLTYKGAGYNGHVDVQARSRTSSGLEGTMGTLPSQGDVKELPWVGDKEGVDTMKVRTPGWVGLYF